MSAPNTTLTLVCWNINGIRAWHARESSAWFLNKKPDFFCIQEIKAHPEQIPLSIKEVDGYAAAFNYSKVKKGYSGVGIYAKTKPEHVSFGMTDGESDEEGRIVTHFYSKVAIITCYFPNGGGGPVRLAYKLDFYKKFLEYINTLRDEGFSIIFCGDINTAHEAIDLARPKENEQNTGFLPEERAWLDEVVENGYVDAFRHLHPEKTGAYTYWDMKTRARERNVGWRIDYFFVSDDLADSIVSCEIHDDVYGSDHCPLSLTIKVDL